MSGYDGLQIARAFGAGGNADQARTVVLPKRQPQPGRYETRCTQIAAPNWGIWAEWTLALPGKLLSQRLKLASRRVSVSSSRLNETRDRCVILNIRESCKILSSRLF